MDLYHAWQAAAQTVFGAEAAAAAAHRTPRALVPAGSPAAGSVTATRVPGPSSAGKAAYTDFWFNVTWQVNATEVLPSDRLVVVWEPPAGTSDDAAINDRDPLQSAFVSALAPDTYDTTGTGSAIVWVPVMRQALRFAYVRQGEFTLWLNAMSVGYATAPPIFPNAPAGVKLTGGVGGGGKADAASLTAAPSAVSVTWQTRDIMAGGRVVWGPAGGPLDRVAPAVSGDGSWGSTGAGTVFKADTGYCFGIAKPATLSGAPWDFKSLGVINRATLSGLAPGATYEFTVFPGTATGPDDGSNFTASGTFTTPPAARDYSATTRLVVIADGGVTLPTPGGAWDQPDGNLFYQGKAVIPATIATPGSAAYAAVQGALALFGLQSVQPGAGRVIDGVLARVAAAAGAGKPIHGIAFTGDISYARGEATQWDVWSDAWWPTGAGAPAFAPFLSAQGNHESCGPPIFEPLKTGIDDGGECGQGSARLLGAPTPDGPGKWWYASRNGPLTVLHLNSDQLLTAGSAQNAWLAAALRAIDRTDSPWLAVALHRPLYADDPTTDLQAPAAEMTAGIERLLVTYSVDLVITGHLHTYQRSCHVAKGNCFDRPSGGGIAKACEGVALDPVTEAKCKAKEWVRDKADEVEAKTQKLLSAKAGGGGGVASTAPQCPPAGYVAPVHVLLGNAGFRAPVQAWAEKPAWLAVAARTYGFGEIDVTRTSLTLTATTPDGATTLDAFSLHKPKWWVPPSPAEVGRWYDGLGPPAPVPDVIQVDQLGTLVSLLTAIKDQNPALLRCVFFWFLFSFFLGVGVVVMVGVDHPARGGGRGGGRPPTRPLHSNRSLARARLLLSHTHPPTPHTPVRYYDPGTPAYALAHNSISGPNGETWPPEDVWTVVAPVLNYSTAGGTGPSPGTNYLYRLVAGPQNPGRLYYGNGTMRGVAGPTGLPV